MNRVVFANPLSSWAYAIGSALLAWALVSLFRGVLVRRLEKLAARTPTIADDLVVELVRSIRESYVAIAALSLGLLSLDLLYSLRLGLKWAAAAVLVLQSLRTADRLIEHWVGHYAARRGNVDRTTLAALSYGLRGLTFLVVAVVALHNIGVNVTGLVATLGVGGIAIALALQNILGDLFAALSIVLDKPFMVGDAIAVDQFEGNVEHVGLKTTRVRSINGEQVVFSNTDLLKSRLRNYSRREGRRMVFTISVAPGTGVARLARVPVIIADVVGAESRANLQRTHFVGPGPLGFDVETAILIPHPDYNYAFDVRQAILLEVYTRMELEGIALARPANAAVSPAPSVA
ncbi:MAG TPA: mechanosensitive ion channel domain-containing protein [Gemmatimonadaceae bacterium]|nr:mechanosensitive ion channel domain-containing protein [Gemmatimonadaceae bacterium]